MTEYRILTIVSLVFSPIGFVTSVFGMQILPKSADLVALAIVMPIICVPVYFVIYVLAAGRSWFTAFGYVARRRNKRKILPDLEQNEKLE